MPQKKPVVLCILDGWGMSDDKMGNAVALANTPCFDTLNKNYPNSTLTTFGPDVGLPTGQMGNSEVGHMTIGAGRVIYQNFTRINKALDDGDFQKPNAKSSISKSKR